MDFEKLAWRVTLCLVAFVITLVILCAVWPPMRELLPDWMYSNGRP